MEEDEVKGRLKSALGRLAHEDGYLLEKDLSERCIAARLAMYLQDEFREHKVDVEYNRDGDTPKRLNLHQECANYRDEHGEALVVPDVVVHCRGSEGPNVLVLEVKKVSNPVGLDCDRARVLAFRAQLRYQFGALIVCETRAGGKHNVWIEEWFTN